MPLKRQPLGELDDRVAAETMTVCVEFGTEPTTQGFKGGECPGADNGSANGVREDNDGCDPDNDPNIIEGIVAAEAATAFTKCDGALVDSPAANLGDNSGPVTWGGVGQEGVASTLSTEEATLYAPSFLGSREQIDPISLTTGAGANGSAATVAAKDFGF